MKLLELITQYIEYKRSFGMHFRQEAFTLKSFSKAVGNINIKNINTESVKTYIAGNGTTTSSSCQKYDTLNGFYKYIISRGYLNSSPLPTTRPKRSRSNNAYIYSTNEFIRLLKATKILNETKSHIDTVTLKSLLLLLFNTGLRIGEAISLTLKNISLSTNIIRICHTKFFKSRLVPISPKLGIVLQNYINKKYKKITVKSENSFLFIKKNGYQLTYSSIHRAFRKLCDYCCIHRNDGTPYQPRIHDIRHTFAVNRLLEWYKKGADVQRLLPYLSTYLGHVNISSTQRYLKMTPVLLHEASLRFEKYVFSEVIYDK
jgi:site-specific recombinase XerD